MFWNTFVSVSRIRRIKIVRYTIEGANKNQYFFDLILYVRDQKRSSFSNVLIKAESDHPVRCHYFKVCCVKTLFC
ncbi:Uncharacterized protein APZ42_027364 [Daphnia magna]|uniref:Uncharacterized protein n=1 Tax=Daphnia magna TaxID=35525 RepID=A0A164RI23_9CRUS|nr:Uncharacterized protein APZ42_027364 [Daphnia magna]